MEKINGWDVYLKIKQIARNSNDKLQLHADGTHKPHIHIEDLVKEMGLSADHAREYTTALSKLDFIQFTDHTKNIFVIIDMER